MSKQQTKIGCAWVKESRIGKPYTKLRLNVKDLAVMLENAEGDTVDAVIFPNGNKQTDTQTDTQPDSYVYIRQPKEDE